MSALLLPGVSSQRKAAALPLDGVVSAVAAWSAHFLLRKSYLGNPLVRVRRSSDDTEADIGAVLAAGVYTLDSAALTDFCGSGDGFVTTYYAQIGSFDLAIASAANQPRIVNAGVVATNDGFTVIPFDGSNDALIQSSINQSQPFLHSMVAQVRSAGTLFDSTATAQATVNPAGGPRWNANFGTNFATLRNVAPNLELYTVLANGGLSEQWVNNTSIATGNAGALPQDGITMGRNRLGASYCQFDHTAHVVYTDAAEKAAIEIALAGIYGITLA